MKVQEMLKEAVELAPLPKKYASRAERYIRSELGSAMKSAKLAVTPEGTHKAKFVLDFDRAVRPNDLKAIDEDFRDMIRASDKEGHIHSLEEGDGTAGAEFGEALLYSLRPGMVVRAEAFFPTLEYDVVWKQIMKRG